MNREDIIRMARESGMELYGLGKNRERFIYHLERFAALVAAAEREKVARWQIGSGYATGHGDTIEDLLVELEWQVREAEREACAMQAWALVLGLTDQDTADIVLRAIRARGQA